MYAYSKTMQLGRSPKILFVFGIILILLVSGFIFFIEYQSQIHADNSGNCLVTNERSEIIDAPQTGPIQNCGVMQVSIGGFTDCSVGDVGISGSTTGVTVKVESASLGVTRIFLPTYCQARHILALPVDTTRNVNKYSYTITAPGYETMIGTVDLIRTPYNAPGSKYDGYVYYSGGIFAIYRQKTHTQGALRVSAMQYANLPVKVTGPNGYELETRTYESAGDIEGLAPGFYTVELKEEPFAYLGLGGGLRIPEAARKQVVNVETGKVTLVVFSDQSVAVDDSTSSLASPTTASSPLALVVTSPSPSPKTISLVSPSPKVLASPTSTPKITPSLRVTSSPTARPTSLATATPTPTKPQSVVQSLLNTFSSKKTTLTPQAVTQNNATESGGGLAPSISADTQESNVPQEIASDAPTAQTRKGVLRRFADWLKEFFFGDLTF